MYRVVNQIGNIRETLDIDTILNKTGGRLYRQVEAKLKKVYGFRPDYSAVMRELPFIFEPEEFMEATNDGKR